MENNLQRCTCGDTSVSYHPDENQHEPNCWDCWHQANDKRHALAFDTHISAEDDLPF